MKKYSSFEEMFEDIGKWADKTFPGQTVEGKCNHLLKEVKELKEEWDNSGYSSKTDEEWADCFILLAAIAKRIDMKPQYILSIVSNKMQKNKARKWSPPGEDGTSHHIEEICYKTGEPCEHGCQGLCKDSQ